MPPVIIPVALAAGAATIGYALGVTTIAAAVVSVGATAVAAGVGYLNQAKSDTASPVDSGSIDSVALGAVNAQRDTLVRQAVPPRRIVYGACKIGGFVFFQDNDNPYLYIGVGLSDGVIDGVTGVEFGDNVIPFDGSGDASPGTIYYSYFTIETANGDAAQLASTMLTAAFSSLTSDFRQRGVARAVCRLNWGADATSHSALWGDSLSPKFSLRGVKVYDPRDGAQSATNSATWVYSSNNALCLAHALTNAWDVKLSYTDIDWASVSECATLCDTLMTYNSASVKTFELAGVFEAATDMASQVTSMLASFGAVLIDVDGKIGMRMDGSRSPVWTVTDVDIIEFGDFAHAGAYENTYNAIKARFFDATDNAEEKTTPVYEIASAVASEGLRETSLDLRYVAGSHSAQILAYRELYRSRAGKRLSLTLSDAAMYLQALDRITIESENAPFVNGDYEVVQVDMAQFGAVVQLREYPTAAYANPTSYLV